VHLALALLVAAETLPAHNAALRVAGGEGVTEAEAVHVEERLWMAFAPLLKERGFVLVPLAPLYAYLDARGVPKDVQHKFGDSVVKSALTVKLRELDVEVSWMNVLSRPHGAEVLLTFSATGLRNDHTLAVNLLRAPSFEALEPLLEKGAPKIVTAALEHFKPIPRPDSWPPPGAPTPAPNPRAYADASVRRGMSEKSIDLIRGGIAAGAALELEDENRNTPLFWACFLGDDALVETLLGKGANFRKRNALGRTPLVWAANAGHVAIVNRLAKAGADIEAPDDLGAPVLSYTAQLGRTDVMLRLLELGAKVDWPNHDGRTALNVASTIGSAKGVELLLEHGAGINHQSKGGLTPLMDATLSGHAAIVATLLRKGANPELRDSEKGATALTIAAYHGRADIVQALIQGKADVNARDAQGFTPLHYAIALNRAEAARLLLAAGAGE
jgi:ankyrin repeat protein